MAAIICPAWVPAASNCRRTGRVNCLRNGIHRRVSLMVECQQQRELQQKLKADNGRVQFAIPSRESFAWDEMESLCSKSTGFVPEAEFYKVEAILRPWRLNQVTAALIGAGIRGVTVTDVRGFGSQGGSVERHAGSEFKEDSFIAKVKVEVVVSNDQVEAVIDSILEEARTGEIGDGKIFIVPVADVVRVRTGERGLKAERMAGGRAELLQAIATQPGGRVTA